MRLSIYDHVLTPPATGAAPQTPVDPTAPDVSFLAREPAAALQSFFATVERITADNPVAIARLMELAGKARQGQITAPEVQELQTLRAQAARQATVAALVAFPENDPETRQGRAQLGVNTAPPGCTVVPYPVCPGQPILSPV